VPSHSVNEVINSLSIAHITYLVLAGTVLRLALVRARGVLAQSSAELLESGLLVVVGMFLIIRPFVLQAFFIPSPSMEPTLIGKNGSGDRILVNKLEYRVGTPGRDDVVVFVPPPSALDGERTEEAPGVPINFIKRLIAVPGDRIAVTAGKVWIDGEPYSHAAIRARLAEAGVFGDVTPEQDLQADHHIRFTENGVMVDGSVLSNSRLATLITGTPRASVRVVPGQTYINGRRLREPFIAEDPDYDLQIYDGKSLKFDAIQGPRLNGEAITMREYAVDRSTEPEPVPPHTYFMMGDNRNDSKDSTEWGPLDERRIVGRAQFVFWPLRRLRAIQ
jgi:signal peptidase I